MYYTQVVVTMDQEIYYWGKNLFRHVSIWCGFTTPTSSVASTIMCNTFVTFFGSNPVQVLRGPRSTNAQERDRRCQQAPTAFILNN